MKCSSRKNCDPRRTGRGEDVLRASMKCSSRKNCDLGGLAHARARTCLNEVQFPKELRLVVLDTPISAVHKNATFSHSDVHRGRQADPVRRMFFQPRKRRCVLGFCRTITWSRGSNMGSVHQGRQQPSWRGERLRPAVRCMPVVDTKRKVRGNADRSHQSSCASSVAAARITGLPLTLRTKPSQFRLAA